MVRDAKSPAFLGGGGLFVYIHLYVENVYKWSIYDIRHHSINFQAFL